MSRKGIKTTADTLTKEELETLYNFAVVNKAYDLAVLIVCGAYYGIHYGDIVNLTWADVLESDTIFVSSKRNGRLITVTNTQEAKEKLSVIADLLKVTKLSNSVMCCNRFGGTSTLQMINRKLKQINVGSRVHKGNLSSESFRKTFGRNIYDLLPDTLKISGLKMLSEYYGHISIEQTAAYIGIGSVHMDEFENPSELFRYVEMYKRRESLTDNEIFDKEFIKKYTMKSYVYLMKDYALPKVVKIGMSDNPFVREKTLQCEKPTITMYKYLELDCRKDALDFEDMLHKKYSKERVRGEWFALTEKQLSELLSAYPWIDNTETHEKQVKELKELVG